MKTIAPDTLPQLTPLKVELDAFLALSVQDQKQEAARLIKIYERSPSVEGQHRSSFWLALYALVFAGEAVSHVDPRACIQAAQNIRQATESIERIAREAPEGFFSGQARTVFPWLDPALFSNAA